MTNKAPGLGGLPQGNMFSEIPDFTKIVHTRENTVENEAHLNANRFHFTGQAAVVLSLLMRGVVLNTSLALTHYHIGDLRRRIKDIKDYYKEHPEGATEIDEMFMYDKDGKRTRFKIWFIREAITEATAVRYKIDWKKKRQ